MRVAVHDLVDQPGSTRELSRVVERDELTDKDSWGAADEALRSPIEIDLRLDSVIEGLLVHGTVAFTLAVDCARCTESFELEIEEPVSELFVDPMKADPEDEWDEGYELLEARTSVDLSALLRDVVVLAVPTRPLHPEPCAPPTIEGVEVRTEDEDATLRASTPDPRWAALADLDVPGPN